MGEAYIHTQNVALFKMVTISSKTVTSIKQNITVSLINIAFMVVAALIGMLGLVTGLLLNEASAILVIANALRLLKWNSKVETASMIAVKERTLSPIINENKLEQELGTVTSKTEGLGCCCAEKGIENRTILPIIDKKRETKLETLISRTDGQSCCCEEKMVENRTLLPIREKKEKEGLGSVANRIEGTGCCCEEKVIENEVPVTIISEKKGEGGLETMTLQIEGLGCSCEGQIIEKKMKLLQGVKTFSLNPITNQIKVTFDPLTVSILDIEKVVSKAGMKAVLIKSK